MNSVPARDLNQVLVSLNGSVHYEKTVAIKNELLEYISQGYRQITIDMSQVKHIDAAGLGSLVFLWKKAKENGADITVTGLNGDLRELFEITHLDQLLSATRYQQ